MYFLPHMELAIAKDIVYIFIRTIVANYRLLDKVILDKDKLFTSHFYTSLIALLRAKRKLSTAFHLQIDGQIERTN